MKQKLYIAGILAISILSTSLTSCLNTDIDQKDRGFQAVNPLEDVSIPDGFRFSTTSVIHVNVDVNDVYNGQYDYVVRIFDNNPLTSDRAVNELVAGVATTNKPFSTEISLPKTAEFVYVEQTDPRGRSVIKEYPVAENVSCDFSTVQNTTANGVKTRSANVTGSDIVVPSYSTVPANAIEISQMTTQSIQSNTNYKISTNYSGTFTHWGSSNSKLFISGTWTIPSDFNIQDGLEIIVLNSGKIIASNGAITLNGSTTKIEIMKGGSAEFQTLQFSNKNDLYNLGTLKSKTISNNPGLIYNGTDASFTATSMSVGGAKVVNFGSMTFDSFETTWGSELENNCSITVAKSFTFAQGKITQNQGSIVAQSMTFNGNNGSNAITLNNGSMLQATDKMSLGGVTMNGTGTISLVKSPEISCSYGVEFDGVLMVEANNLTKDANSGWKPYVFNSPVQMAAYGKSDVVIVVCTGTVNVGNPGTELQNPAFPISIEDKTNFTYAFEDGWPLYGDFDMNDLVLRVNKKTLTFDANNKVIAFNLEVELLAVGASKPIAAALQLDNVPASSITEVVTYNVKPTTLFDFTNKNIESNQEQAVIPLFADAHQLMGKTEYGFINTIKDISNNVVETPKINISVIFTNSNLTAADFINSKLNFFIITDAKSTNRKEIHLSGYKPTNKASNEYFGIHNDATSISKGIYYISTENLAWGIMVPTNFRYPKEFNMITDAYSKFSNWLNTGGIEDNDWYNTFDESKVY